VTSGDLLEAFDRQRIDALRQRVVRSAAGDQAAKASRELVDRLDGVRVLVDAGREADRRKIRASLETIATFMEPSPREATLREARQAFERATQEQLGMTGEAFLQALECGDLDERRDEARIARVIALLPLVE